MEKELFQLSGYINGQNNRVWSAENPQALHKKSSAFVNDWYSVCRI
jgi:hypothetical protein